jgi:hypothetical protein
MLINPLINYIDLKGGFRFMEYIKINLPDEEIPSEVLDELTNGKGDDDE